MKTIGIILAIVGAAALLYGGFDYTRSRDVLQLGSLEISTTEHKSFPVPAAAGLLVLAGGVTLIVVGARRARAQ